MSADGISIRNLKMTVEQQGKDIEEIKEHIDRIANFVQKHELVIKNQSAERVKKSKVEGDK